MQRATLQKLTIDSRPDDRDAGTAEKLEAWIRNASRDDLVERIRADVERSRKQEEPLARAAEWLRRRLGTSSKPQLEALGVVSAFSRSDLASVAQVLLEIAQQLTRESVAHHEIERFMTDYRPDLAALMIAYRRFMLARVAQDWPCVALDNFVRNTLVDSIECPSLSAYANPAATQYWASVVEVFDGSSFDILETHGQVARDTGDKALSEGFLAGMTNDRPKCPYDRRNQAYKAAMWWRGQTLGHRERHVNSQCRVGTIGPRSTRAGAIDDGAHEPDSLRASAA